MFSANCEANLIPFSITSNKSYYISVILENIMCFYERSIPWLFLTSPLKNTQNKTQSKIKTEENVHNLVVELLGIMHRNKYLKNCIEMKNLWKCQSCTLTSAEFIIMAWSLNEK